MGSSAASLHWIRLRPMLDRALTVLIDAPEPLPAPGRPRPYPMCPRGLGGGIAPAGPAGVQAATATRATDRVFVGRGTDQGEAALRYWRWPAGGQPTVTLRRSKGQ